jgi:Na+/H+-dicarboxylate symporter
MLPAVFVSSFSGIVLVQLRSEQAKPVRTSLAGLIGAIIRLVHSVMAMVQWGVYALMADTITSLARGSQVWELIGALGFYCMAVVMGLLIQALGVYPLLLKLLSKMSLKKFFSGIAPAQLVAFSTSSSGATLPVTMEQCKEKLGVSDEVASFVLPLGATINMDGTALYQAVAAVFIAQALALQLGIEAQLTIIFTAVLASIGTAAVPGAGIIMLVIILEAIEVPSGGIALILGVDRILDMLRTVTNITGDATVSVIVASSENQLQAVPSVQAAAVESS